MISQDPLIKNLIQLIKKHELNLIQIEIQGIVQRKKNFLPTIIDLAIFSAENGYLDEAEVIFKQLKKLNIENKTIFYNLGLIYCHKKNYLEAINEFDAVLNIDPNDVSTLINKGSILNDLGYFNNALEVLEKAISISPSIAQAWSNIGIAYNKLGFTDSALNAYNKAIELKPNYAEAYFNKGIALRAINQYSAAIECFEKAHLINPSYAEAWLNKGNTLFDIAEFKLADLCYEKSISLRPNYSEAWFNKGNLFFKLKNYELAIKYYEKAVVINPKIDFGRGSIMAAKSELCEWTNYDNNIIEINLSLEKREKIITPITLLSLIDNPSLNKICSEIYVHNSYINSECNLPISLMPSNKIIIGYFSPDFYNHAVSTLTAELFESHNRNDFEVIGFSYGNSPKDEMRQRLELAFDQFYEVQSLSDREIVDLARKHNVEIAVDLAGHTYAARSGIFANRAAPIQISYLGFPGTQGASFMDYILADRFLIPTNNREFYSEKIIYLPFYMVSPSKRQVSEAKFNRIEMNLPEEGFIYCCFNANYKLTPAVFDAWLNILNSVDKSILWLLKENEHVEMNLKKHAQSFEVDPRRLIFAERVPNQNYLMRYQSADLFLDTYPYNAGTTANDALWTGLPVLTLSGNSFSSRMAGSQLTQLGLQDLVTESISGYVAKAIQIGHNPELAQKYKQVLENSRNKNLVFDSLKMTKCIEMGYKAASEQFRSRLCQEDIYVDLNKMT